MNYVAGERACGVGGGDESSRHLHCTFGDCHVEITENVVRVLARSVVLERVSHADRLLPSQVDVAVLRLQRRRMGSVGGHIRTGQVLPAALECRIVVHVADFAIPEKKNNADIAVKGIVDPFVDVSGEIATPIAKPVPERPSEIEEREGGEVGR